jgi:hypothetical protein
MDMDRQVRQGLSSGWHASNPLLLLSIPANTSARQLEHDSRDITAALSSFTRELQPLCAVQPPGFCVSPVSKYPHESPILHHLSCRRRLTEELSRHNTTSTTPTGSLHVVVTGVATCTRPRHDRLILRVVAPPSSRPDFEVPSTVTTSRPATRSLPQR